MKPARNTFSQGNVYKMDKYVLLPLCLEAWPNTTMKYAQPATNYFGWRTIRQPLHEAELLWVRPMPNKPKGIHIMRTSRVLPKFQ
jgi:hypothetical protein